MLCQRYTDIGNAIVDVQEGTFGNKMEAFLQNEQTSCGDREYEKNIDNSSAPCEPSLFKHPTPTCLLIFFGFGQPEISQNTNWRRILNGKTSRQERRTMRAQPHRSEVAEQRTHTALRVAP